MRYYRDITRFYLMYVSVPLILTGRFKQIQLNGKKKKSLIQTVYSIKFNGTTLIPFCCFLFQIYFLLLHSHIFPHRNIDVLDLASGHTQESNEFISSSPNTSVRSMIFKSCIATRSQMTPNLVDQIKSVYSDANSIEKQ